MPGGGGDPAAQSIAIQMKQFHPGRSPKPGAFDRHVAGLAQSLAQPHRDYCWSLNSARRQLRRRLLHTDPGQSHTRRALLWDLCHLEATCRRARPGRPGTMQSRAHRGGSCGPNSSAGVAQAPIRGRPGVPLPGPGADGAVPSAPPVPGAQFPDVVCCAPEVFLPILGGAGPAGSACASGSAGAAVPALPATGPPASDTMQAISAVLRGLAHAAAALTRSTLSMLARLVFASRPTCAFSGPPFSPPKPPKIKMPISS